MTSKSTSPIAKVWAAVSASLLVGGCEMPPARFPSALAPTQQGIAIFVDEPKLALADSDCVETVVANQVVLPIREALIRAGYRLVTSPDAADVKITMGASGSDCWSSSAGSWAGTIDFQVGGRLTMTAERGGTVLVETSASGESNSSSGAHATSGTGLVGALLAAQSAVSENPRGIALRDCTPGGCVTNWPTDFTDALTRAVVAQNLTPGTPMPVASAAAAAGGVGASGTGAAGAAGPKLLAGQARPNAYALVVGVEKYRDAPAVPGARLDATRFAELAKTTLGVPDDHIVVALDERASKGDLDKHLDWLKGNVPSGGRVYFFFAGHGAPEAASSSAYLMPHDADPKAIASTGVPLSGVLARLGETKAESVVAFVDSCFSGHGGRSVLPPGARPLLKVTATSSAQAPRVALLASAGASEISGPTGDGSQGLFTSLLVEGVGTGVADFDGDGDLSLGEIASWVAPRVTREAKKANRDQTPVLTVGKAMGEASRMIVVKAIAK
jgi:hypothetical protein